MSNCGCSGTKPAFSAGPSAGVRPVNFEHQGSRRSGGCGGDCNDGCGQPSGGGCGGGCGGSAAGAVTPGGGPGGVGSNCPGVTLAQFTFNSDTTFPIAQGTVRLFYSGGQSALNAFAINSESELAGWLNSILATLPVTRGNGFSWDPVSGLFTTPAINGSCDMVVVAQAPLCANRPIAVFAPGVTFPTTEGGVRLTFTGAGSPSSTAPALASVPAMVGWLNSLITAGELAADGQFGFTNVGGGGYSISTPRINGSCAMQLAVVVNDGLAPQPVAPSSSKSGRKA